MSKAPAFQFYTGDWRKDPAVQSLDHEHKGIWIDLLCIMWDSPERGRLVLPNGDPMPDEAICSNLGLPLGKWEKSRSKLVAYGVASEDSHGVLYNRRMARETDLSRVRAEAGRKGAEVRWGDSKTMAKDGPSSSSSSSTSVKPKEKPLTEAKRQGTEVLVPDPDLDLAPPLVPGNLVQERVAQVRGALDKKQEHEQRMKTYIEIVFLYWREMMGKTGRTILDDDRKRRLRARLRENGGDVAELLCVVDGALQDDFLMGTSERSENGKKYDGIGTLFKNRGQVEKLAPQSKYFGREVHPFMQDRSET